MTPTSGLLEICTSRTDTFRQKQLRILTCRSRNGSATLSIRVIPLPTTETFKQGTCRRLAVRKKLNGMSREWFFGPRFVVVLDNDSPSSELIQSAITSNVIIMYSFEIDVLNYTRTLLCRSFEDNYGIKSCCRAFKSQRLVHGLAPGRDHPGRNLIHIRGAELAHEVNRV